MPCDRQEGRALRVLEARVLLEPMWVNGRKGLARGAGDEPLVVAVAIQLLSLAPALRRFRRPMQQARATSDVTQGLCVLVQVHRRVVQHQELPGTRVDLEGPDMLEVFVEVDARAHENLLESLQRGLRP